jgi:hypothetical protein
MVTTILTGTRRVLLVASSVLAGAMAFCPAQGAAALESVTTPTFLSVPAQAPTCTVRCRPSRHRSEDGWTQALMQR